ncbi:MAG: family 43 glycosylhydrolase [Bacteroidales bacterium]|nr:family 43 glycosylhydrolase [Bacteroidales bacterium]
MKKIVLIILLVPFCYSINAQYLVYLHETDKNFYVNPIFAGDYPDPSLLVDGKDYYVVHSSFEYYPGLLIWHSEDLINWTPVTNALHHNVLGGFLSLRIGLCSIGVGRVRFKNFIYKPIR